MSYCLSQVRLCEREMNQEETENFLIGRQEKTQHAKCGSILDYINTFTAIVDLSRFNNSCLKSPASTLVDLTFQSRALRSFSLNQLRNLSL